MSSRSNRRSGLADFLPKPKLRAAVIQFPVLAFTFWLFRMAGKSLCLGMLLLRSLTSGVVLFRRPSIAGARIQLTSADALTLEAAAEGVLMSRCSLGA
jgi:hypothetical protein